MNNKVMKVVIILAVIAMLASILGGLVYIFVS
jgi:Na+-translocating ferredoxin:NAD+ oxidoreductase RnfG subunit